MVVKEILNDGRRQLASSQLESVRHMANRVGFTVIEPLDDLGPDVAKIRLQIAMADPVFVARLCAQHAAT